MPRFDFPKRSANTETLPYSRGRYYKVAFQNHDGNIMGMYCVEKSTQQNPITSILSVDSKGGLKILDVDSMTSDVLDLFENDPVNVTAVTLNRSTNVLYMGMNTGQIWSSDLESSIRMDYTHNGVVSAIASFKTIIISAGLDKIIKMYHIPKGQVVATLQCTNEVSRMIMMPSIVGGPVAIADTEGILSVWSPHLLGIEGVKDSVQNVCHMEGYPVALDEIKAFGRTCLLCVTSRWIRIWAISIVGDDGGEVVSILNDPVFSLVRSIAAPEDTEFTSCCNTGLNPTSTLLTGCSNGSVYQWDALSGMRLRKFDITSHANTFVVYIASKYMFCACDISNDLNLIDPHSSSLVNSSSPMKDITCGALCDFRGVVTVLGGGNVLHLLVNKGTKSPSTSTARPNTGEVTALSILALESSDHIVIIAGFATGLMTSYVCAPEEGFDFASFATKDIHVYRSRVTLIRSFGTSDLVATCSESESVIIWLASERGLHKEVTLNASVFATCLAYNPQGTIVVGTANGSLSMYDCTTCQRIAGCVEAHQDDAVHSVGITSDDAKDTNMVLTVGKRCLAVNVWRKQGHTLVFQNRIDLPGDSVDVRFWEKGESSMVFIESKLKFSYCMDIKNPSRGVVRYFSSGRSSSLLTVSGNSSPVVLTLGEQSRDGRVVDTWNNDLHDEQVCQNHVLNEFDAFQADPMTSKTSFYKAIRTHPSFPGCLQWPDPHQGGATLFAQAILLGRSEFVVEFLPCVPLAVLSKCMLQGESHSLLWLALNMKDTVSTDLILLMWTDLLCSPPDSIEYSTWHFADLFEDLKVLSYQYPAKFSDFIQKLDIPQGHSINCKECDGKDIGTDEVWMRGSALRVVPQFWKHVKTPYPDLQSRVFEPEKESQVVDVEAPHKNPNLREPYTRTFEPRPIKVHPSVNVVSRRADVAQLGKGYLDANRIKHGDKNELKLQVLSHGGTVVQSYIHPIPYAASGIDFLQICLICCSASGRSPLMSSPAVATVIDYKWNSYFGDLHTATTLHYLYVLIIFSIVTVYFDAMAEAPFKTGLPVLAWGGTIFAAVSYLMLLVQALLRLDDEWPVAYRDVWFWIGGIAYVLAISGIVMTLVQGESTFNSRCVLSISSLFLFLNFIYFLL